MKLEKHFTILKQGQETIAEILTTFVYKEDIYMALLIDLTGEVELYQVLPHGLKQAPRPVVDDFMTFMADQNQTECEESEGAFVAK